MNAPLAVIRGTNDVASAVALRLFQAGWAVLLLEVSAAPVSRRGQSFADALFDGVATLEGVAAHLVADPVQWRAAGIPEIALTVAPFSDCLAALSPEVLVDARMRKRAVPRNQRGLAPLVLGLGPNFVAGGNVDLAVETAWGDDLGRVIESGSTRDLAGEPKPIGGYGRERYIYALSGGRFHTVHAIGDVVTEGETVASIGDLPVSAPKSGILRGLVRDGLEVVPGIKVVEVVPHGARVFGLSERPARIAAGVVEAVLSHSRNA